MAEAERMLEYALSIAPMENEDDEEEVRDGDCWIILPAVPRRQCQRDSPIVIRLLRATYIYVQPPLINIYQRVVVLC